MFLSCVGVPAVVTLSVIASDLPSELSPVLSSTPLSTDVSLLSFHSLWGSSWNTDIS
jgi:hypothetical protein